MNTDKQKEKVKLTRELANINDNLSRLNEYVNQAADSYPSASIAIGLPRFNGTHRFADQMFFFDADLLKDLCLIQISRFAHRRDEISLRLEP